MLTVNGAVAATALLTPSGEADGPGNSDAAVERAMAALENAGVRWATLRDATAGRTDTDTDLLVDPDDAWRLEDLLHPHGFVRLRTWRHGIHRFFYAYEEATDTWAKIDVVTAFAFHGHRVLPAWTVAASLERATSVGRRRRLHPHDEFWALLLHCLLDRGVVRASQFERLQQLGADDPSGPLRDAIGHPGICDAAIARVQLGDARKLILLRGPLAARLQRQSAGDRLRDGVNRVASPLLKAVLRPGVKVAVLGADGTGKSTLVASLADAFPIPGSTFYLGLYGARTRRAQRFGFAGQVALAWGTHVAAEIERRRGRLVLFDRYAYDALRPVSPARRGWKRRVRRAVIGALAPRPDLVVVLDAPTSTLLARSADHDAATVEERRAGYLHLARFLSSRMATVLIDTQGDRDAVRRRATRLVWRAFAEARDGRRDAGRRYRLPTSRSAK